MEDHYRRMSVETLIESKEVRTVVGVITRNHSAFQN